MAAAIPIRRLLLYSAIAAGVCTVAVLGGCVVHRSLPPRTSEGAGFLVFVAHLSSWIPIDALVLLKAATAGSKSLSIVGLLTTTRKARWSPATIYACVALQVSIASFGLGLALGLRGSEPALLLAFILLAWRFLLARYLCERQETPHHVQRPPYSQSERILAFVADVPLILICAAIFFVTNHFLWLLGAGIVLSYTLVVRLGHYEAYSGPITYVASLAGLLGTSVLVWPVAPYFAPDLRGIPGWLSPAALAMFSLRLVLRKRVARRQRILPAMFVGSSVLVAIWAAATERPLSFHEESLFGWSVPMADVLIALLGVFAVATCWYALVIVVAKEQEWIVGEEPKVRRTPY